MSFSRSGGMARQPGGSLSGYLQLINLGRHLVSAENYRLLRLRAFASWEKAVAI